MSLLIQYLIKLSISLAIVWLFYQFVLRRLTFYNSNRWYLLGYSLLSFFIPFINVSPVLEKNEATANGFVQFIPSVNQYTVALEEASHCPIPIWSTQYDKWDLIAFALMVGAGIFLLRFIIRFVSFIKMQRQAKLISTDEMNLYQVNDNIIPFSFGNSVFINSRLHTEAELREIIRHEFVHVKQKHTIDIICGEVLCILNWYNPFAWLLKASIRQNLEFIADNKALQNGIDKKQYQYLLLKVIGNNHFSIAQKFNFSSLKKRIAMMNKLKTAKIHLLRFLFVLPLLAVILISFRGNKQDTILPAETSISSFLTNDTIPGELNDKGYIIDVIGRKGNAIVIVKDKGNEVVERIAMSKWKENEKFYEDKYGELPPPPPPLPPDPPSPPQPIELPDNVKKIEVNDKKGTVTLKDGKVETYDFNKKDESEAFKKKYGEIIPSPPTPPTTPARPTREYSLLKEEFLERNKDVENLGWVYNNVRENRPVVMHVIKKDGTSEKYDLDDPADKGKAERKYGELPVPPTEPVEVAAPAKTSVSLLRKDGTDNIEFLCDDYEITDKKAVMYLKNGQKEEYDLTNITERRKFEKKYGQIINVGEGGTAVLSPIAVVNRSDGYTVIAPGSPVVATGANVMAIDPDGNVLTGKEEMLLTITKKTTREQLNEFIRQMQEKGIELKYDNIDFNDGTLVSIKGQIKLKDNTGNFSATDFSKVVISVVRETERTYFKVEVVVKKVTI